eukprot:9336556-Lingulodinium_polyedra.AAC.1
MVQQCQQPTLQQPQHNNTATRGRARFSGGERSATLESYAASREVHGVEAGLKMCSCAERCSLMDANISPRTPTRAVVQQ